MANANEALVKRIAVVVGHAPLARFMATLSEQPIGEIPRTSIPSPYAFSPVHMVWDLNGRPVILVETRHRRHEVYEVRKDAVQPLEAN